MDCKLHLTHQILNVSLAILTLLAPVNVWCLKVNMTSGTQHGLKGLKQTGQIEEKKKKTKYCANNVDTDQ